MNYRDFLESKTHYSQDHGFDPVFIPDQMFDFQKHLLEFACLKGRSAIFADCGMGKTFIGLAWAQNVVQKTGKKVLIITAIAVGHQFIEEGEKFGIDCQISRDGNPTGGITITNYERLHKFRAKDFIGVVCDESSILKNFKGVTSQAIINFVRKMPYRLCCTATPAPNDPIELGTTSEAIGDMGTMDMLGTFFKNNEKNLHPAFIGTKFTFKPHAEVHFWKWVSSWARAVRKPSDLGFDDNGFVLPKLRVNNIILERSKPLPGMLFAVPAVGRKEELAERRVTVQERCERVAELAEKHDCSVVFGNLNDETDLLEQLIPDSVNIKGGKNDLDEREEQLIAFSKGQIKRLITKPKIGAFGMNWQHCAHMTFFPTHSYEQYYQGVRRVYRFGQKRDVNIDVIMTDAQIRMFNNLKKKSKAADDMFSMLVEHMNQSQRYRNILNYDNQIQLPSWI